MDLCGQPLIGMSMSDRMTRALVITALDNAYKFAAKPEGVLIHSDRGSQYCSYDYQAYLKSHGFICSMSRKGDCWDNAPMEAFCRWATISHSEGPQGINSLCPSLTRQTACLSRAAARSCREPN